MANRNFGRVQGTRGASVVLPAKGRIARRGKFRVIATVGLGYAEPCSMFGDTYRHPELILQAINANGLGEEIFDSSFTVEVRFQSNRIDVSRRDLSWGTPGPSGFLAATKGPWNSCYAPHLSAAYGWCASRNIASAMRLLDKARAVARGRDSKFRRCELLQMIIGLQRSGVEVRIWSETLDAKRKAREHADSSEFLACQDGH